MGACASVPRAMRGEFTAAPAPEPAKEETPAATVEKAEEVVTEKKNADDKPDSTADQTQSLGTLLVESEAPKEAESSQPKVEKNESEAAAPVASEVVAAPVASEVVAAPVESEVAVAPVTSKPEAEAEVVAKVEEKKTEVAEKKWLWI